MTKLPLLRYADRRAQPWDNGAGATVELVPWGTSQHLIATASPWRLSIASLDAVAQFSPLPGIYRWFCPAEFDVELTVDGEHRIAHGRCVSTFVGDADVSLIALAHPTHAINLMSESPGEIELRTVPTGALMPEGARIGVVLDSLGDCGRFDLVELSAGQMWIVDLAVIVLTQPEAPFGSRG